MALMTVDQEENSRDCAFFKYIEGMQRMLKPNFSQASVWLWIHASDVQARQSANFVKRYLPEFEAIHSIYWSSRNELLDNAKTCAPPATMYLLFLLKRRDDHTNRLRPNMKAKFNVPSDISYYLDVGRYNKVKYRVYSRELSMKFYLELMKLFCRARENFVGIHCSAKCLLAAKVCLF